MYWYIILNPVSGAGKAKIAWPKIEKLLQAGGFSYTVRFTESRGHAALLAEEAVLKGHTHILGVGGDGVNNEIVNGIMRQTSLPSNEITYALLPIGTGNDWAREYRIPRDPVRRIAALKSPEIRYQDVGLVKYIDDAGAPQSRYFVNVAGMAYDGYIGKQIAANPVTNRLQYLMLVGKYLMQYKLTRARISFNNQSVEDYFYTVNVGLCRYSGGGMQLVPQAVPDDGLLALTFARRLKKYEVIAQTPRFYNGTLLKHPLVEGYQTSFIRVEHTDDTPTPLEADGEYLGVTPVEFSILPKALKIAV